MSALEGIANIQGRTKNKAGVMMTVQIELIPILSLVAGIAILIVPRLLNYIVAAYLIVAGIAGLVS